MLTFKQHLLLTEARRSDGSIVYTEKMTKNVVDRVTAELKGTESATMTRLAKRYARLEVSLEAMKKKREELNERLKTDVQELFNPEDVVLTRVAQTAQFTLTLAKEIKKAEGKTTVNYEKIAAELAKLIPENLQAKVDEITKLYTTIEAAKAPVAKLSVSKEVNEGVMDVMRGWAMKAKAFMKSILSWGHSYDAKLSALEDKFSASKKLQEARTISFADPDNEPGAVEREASAQMTKHKFEQAAAPKWEDLVKKMGGTITWHKKPGRHPAITSADRAGITATFPGGYKLYMFDYDLILQAPKGFGPEHRAHIQEIFKKHNHPLYAGSFRRMGNESDDLNGFTVGSYSSLGKKDGDELMKAIIEAYKHLKSIEK